GGSEDADEMEEVNELEGETYDDCNKNQYSCEMMEVPLPAEETKPGVCVGGKKDGKECSSDEDCPPKPNADENADESAEKPYCSLPQAKQGLNIYNTPFSWIQTGDNKNEGHCCGYNGAGDLGSLTDDKGYICLNKERVSVEGTVAGEQKKSIEEISWGTENAPCEDWCWVNAVGNAKFNIITVKKPAEQPYDVVSNSYEWKECKESSDNTFTWSYNAEENNKDMSSEEMMEFSNRFYCYHEGNRWSWAECAGPESEQPSQEEPKEGEQQPAEIKGGAKRWNTGIKGRYPGEALYTLPLEEEGNVKEMKYGPLVAIDSSYYSSYYDNTFLDFSGYDYLNFMLTFVDESGNPVSEKDIHKPARVILTIYGPPPPGKEVKKEEKEGVILFRRNVLGDVINNPFFAGLPWMHVKVPLPENLKGITHFKIEQEQPTTNRIGVKNVYLSRKPKGKFKFAQKTPLCSGKDFSGENNWLKDIDQGNEGTEVIGDELCRSLYGTNAWLGKDNELDVGADSANCCGDDKNEYYAGKSRAQVSEIAEGQQEKRYGCWNSEIVASADKVMNVEFGVEYKEKEYNVSFEDLFAATLFVIKYNVSTGGWLRLIDCSDNALFKPGESTFKIICKKPFKLSDLPDFDPEGTLIWVDPLTSPNEEYLDVFFYDLTTMEYIPVEEAKTYEFIPDGSVYLSSGSIYLKENMIKSKWNHELTIAAQLKPEIYFPIDKKSLTPTTLSKTANKTYSCTKEECYFSLPGEPEYTITNPHPELYELYFVSKDKDKTKETLIDENHKTFQEYGNIVARKVAQQVLFHNEGVEKEPFSGFYGCEAASFLKEDMPETSLKYFYDKPYCSVVGNNFCSYFYSPKEAQGKYTLINSWSDEPLTKIGYEKIETPAKDENVSSFYEHAELKLKDPVETLGAEKRTNFTTVLPARNFISNAEFIRDGTEIPRWEIFNANGEPVKDEWTYLKDKSQPPLELSSSGEILRTERIAVPKNATLYYSHKGSCTPKVVLADKDGNFPQYAEVNYPEIKTGHASYLILEYAYPCAVEEPMLQLTDSFKPAEYKYVSQHSVLNDYDSRAGASCCPNTYCWNGYACVESMSGQTSTVEYINAGRAYRCVNGNWKLSPLQWDWNGMNWGFCPKEGQCFVLASGKEEYTAKDFYQGNYPSCIDNSSYIFDHYCQSGSWTSRTKFVASKLVEVAESDDFVLYCAPYEDAFLDYQSQMNYVGGPASAEKTVLPKSPLEKAGKEQVSVCYKDILAGEGKKLLSIDEGTCINNVCVLQLKEGKEYSTAFATTLNRPLDDANSFLISLGIPQNKLSQLCTGEKGKFTKCDLSKEKLPGDLYYSEDLNAVIYARDGIDITPGTAQKIMDWLKDLFGMETKITKENKFVTEAKNYNDVYVLKKGEKKVRAMKEVFPEKQTLVAEYENFKTPVCSYVQSIELPAELQQELLPKVMGETELSCTANETMQRVEMVAGLDFFWPQLTGKMRME
ncbi:MAG: hypothetical protein AB1668_02385, partial [Nanoarchaeota archaeon]